MRTITMGVVATLLAVGTADAAIEISAARIEAGEIVVLGRVTRPNEKVTFDDKFEVVSGKDRRFTWRATYHPGDCTVTVKSEPDTREIVVANCGQAGPKGDKGDRGDKGEAGAQGPAGMGGPQGPAGPTGAAGIAGAPGPQGPAGPAGPAGPTGPVGPAGQKGDRGEAGAAGAAGTAGAAAMAAVAPLRLLAKTCQGQSPCRATCEADEALLVAVPDPTEKTLAAATWRGDTVPAEVRIVCGKAK